MHSSFKSHMNAVSVFRLPIKWRHFWAFGKQQCFFNWEFHFSTWKRSIKTCRNWIKICKIWIWNHSKPQYSNWNVKNLDWLLNLNPTKIMFKTALWEQHIKMMRSDWNTEMMITSEFCISHFYYVLNNKLQTVCRISSGDRKIKTLLRSLSTQ